MLFYLATVHHRWYCLQWF